MQQNVANHDKTQNKTSSNTYDSGRLLPGIPDPGGGGGGGGAPPGSGGGGGAPPGGGGGGGAPGGRSPAKGGGGGGPPEVSRFGISGGLPLLFFTKCSTVQSSGIVPPHFLMISSSFAFTF